MKKTKVRKPYRSDEQAIKTAILEFLSFYPQKFMVWPNSSVGIFDPVRKIFRKPTSKFHMNGVADILGIYNDKTAGARPLAIEVKTKVGRVSGEQELFIKRFSTFPGAVAIVARSVWDVKEFFKL